jgi:hypothetical protein
MATRMTSVKDATPEASSSAPGALPPELLMESRCPPTTTTSLARVVPVMVRMTDGWAQAVCRNSSTLTSVRAAGT